MRGVKKGALVLTMLLAGSMMTGCGNGKREITIKTGDGDIVVSADDAVETVKASGKMEKKTVDIPEGSYTFSVEDMTLVNSSIQVSIVPGAEEASIEADDNFIDVLMLEADQGSGEITLGINGEDVYRDVKCTILIPVDVVNIDTGGIVEIDYAVPENAEKIKIHGEGASVTMVRGECAEAVYEANGSAKINASELKVQNVTVKAEGSSVLDVYCENILEVNADGASIVNYSGNPQEVKENSEGVSQINKK